MKTRHSSVFFEKRYAFFPLRSEKRIKKGVCLQVPDHVYVFMEWKGGIGLLETMPVDRGSFFQTHSLALGRNSCVMNPLDTLFSERRMELSVVRCMCHITIP